MLSITRSITTAGAPIFTGAWPVEARYEVVRRKIANRAVRVIRPCDYTHPRYVEPDAAPGIASEFSDVETEEQLLAFTHKYGSLGYARLFPREPKYGGDPVEWSLRHARRVTAAFEIIDRIKRGPAQVRAELPKLLRRIGWDLMGMIEGGKLEVSFTQTGDMIVIEDGKKKPAKTGVFTPGSLSYADWPGDPLRVAWRALAHLINDQIRGLRVEVSEEKLAPVLAFDALLQVIYFQLAGELNSLSVRRCVVCRNFFRAKRTDARHCSAKCLMRASRSRAKKKRRRMKHGALQKR